MKVKRYVGETAQDAIKKVKTDLGRDAIILNTRKIRKRGIIGFFSKPLIEVVATIDSDVNINNNMRPHKASEVRPPQARPTEPQDLNKLRELQALHEFQAKHELQKSKEAQAMRPAVQPIERVAPPQGTPSFKNELNTSLSTAMKMPKAEKQGDKDKLEKDFTELKSMLSKVYDVVKVDYEDSKVSELVKGYLKRLEENEVDRGIINELKEEIIKSMSMEEQTDESKVRTKLYSLLSSYIKDPEPFSFKKGRNVIIFVGPTGVGKTTTLAKLAANMVLSEKKKVGLITADTYRIAAVEQLKTYSEIIGVPLAIIYTPGEILSAIQSYKEKDVVLVDTAGRSHKDKYQLMELKSLIKSSVNYEIYLVLSATTKFSDCVEIVNSYNFIDEFKLLFTKTDETSSYGNILNVAHMTKKPISYVTTGQSVPDDIEIADKGKIINCLLGDKQYERSS